MISRSFGKEQLHLQYFLKKQIRYTVYLHWKELLSSYMIVLIFWFKPLVFIPKNSVKLQKHSLYTCTPAGILNRLFPCSHTLYSLPHSCFWCCHAMLLPTGALCDDSKKVCEGHYTLYEYRNPFFFTMMHQVVSNFSTWYHFYITTNHMLYLLQSIWKSWLLPILLINLNFFFLLP